MSSPPFHQPSVPALWWAEPEREKGAELGNLGSLLQVHPSEWTQMFLHVFPLDGGIEIPSPSGHMRPGM